VNIRGKYLSLSLAFLLLLPGRLSKAQTDGRQAVQPEAEQIMALANRARAAAGAGPLIWDPALALAARKHCLRMAAEGPLSHQYPGELDVSERAGQAGAHFDVIEENVAIGSTPAEIHDEWMHSAGHRTNLLNPHVDRVGIAVVSARGVLYAVADYSRGVQSLTQIQVEARVAEMIKRSSVAIFPDATVARAACSMESGVPRSAAHPPGFILRWQDSEMTQLPQALIDRLDSGRYHQAVVGSCEPRNANGTFTAYRVAVLLY
jgi:hypothetical protein